jgi:hypothetical protein
LTVWTNDCSGGFALACQAGTGLNPRSLAVTDVNGDGRPDLITANGSVNTLSVLTNRGDGVFFSSSELAVGNFPCDVTAADVTGDGLSDLINVNHYDQSLTVLTNNGHGGFAYCATWAVGNGACSVAAADLNGDGKADLTAANMYAYGLSVLFNTPLSYAAAFTGNGSGLTGLNAAGITNGTLADARLSANVALRNAHQTFTGSNVFTGVVTATNPANAFGGSFAGNGAGVTNLNAGNLASGAVPNARLSGMYSSALTLNNVGNSLSGNGSGLTSLSAANLASGTLPDARLSGTYSSALTLNNGGNSFAGNGSGLTSLNANSLASGTVPSARLSGTYSSAVTLNNAGNSFTGNGSGLTGLNAGNLASGSVPDTRLSANVPLLTNNPTFTSPVTMGSFLTLSRTTQSITNSTTTIIPASSHVLLNATGAYALGGIAAGTRVGDVLILQGSSDANTVSVNSSGTIRLTAASHVLGAYDMLMLIWNGTAWVEISFANNS